MPENHPPLETAEEVFRQSGEEGLHAAKPKSNLRLQIVDKC
jgi:hypothetical protein